jgi:hypothetical protein
MPARRPRIAVVALAVSAVAMVLAGCSILSGGNDAHRDPSGTPTATNAHASALSIRVGDCLDDAAVGSTTATATIVPCTGAHDSEAYAEFTLGGSDYPGIDAVQASAEKDCQGTAFADFIGIASSDSTLQISYYYPTDDSWQGGDRKVTCTVYAIGDDGTTAQTTGTLKNAAR